VAVALRRVRNRRSVAPPGRVINAADRAAWTTASAANGRGDEK
jgi:hypothetical protein